MQALWEATCLYAQIRDVPLVFQRSCIQRTDTRNKKIQLVKGLWYCRSMILYIGLKSCRYRLFKKNFDIITGFDSCYQVYVATADCNTFRHVENGQIIKKNMLDARIIIDNLMGQLCIKSVFNISEVELTLVEPTGKINVVKRQKRCL